MTTHEANVRSGTLPSETAVVRQRYDRSARRYDLMTWPMEVLAMDRYRTRLISLITGSHVLEVGVGTGRNLPLYPDTVHVDAIDFSPRMLERAQRRPPRANVHLALMDVEQLQWPSGTFDTVVATCVFCSVPDPVKGLIEIRRVLRPGGQALFLEHMRPGARWLASVFDWLDPIVPRSGPHINRSRVLSEVDTMTPCECSAPHDRRRIVLTGGPGAEVEALILNAREGHPGRWLIESSVDFLDKAARALDVLRGELPECCRGHEVPADRDRVHQHLSGGQSQKS